VRVKIVLAAIDLDDETVLWTNEIDDETITR
jgi:hypothetical protein